MTRKLRSGYWTILLIFSIVMTCTFSNSCSKRTREGIPEVRESPEPIFIDGPILFCWKRPIQPRSGSVQILVDASGSMVGFQRAISPLINLVLHGISQLRDSTLVVESSRICQFSQGFGGKVDKCSEFNKPLESYQPSGDTNLQDAIRAAKNYALTFVLSDGVAATGTGGSGDCAAGVDAACVARALREVIHSQTSEKEGMEWGFWIIPLVAIYDGTFYTEEPIMPSEFKADETIQKVHSDIGIKVAVQNPRMGKDGRLIFGYQGPRALFLIVLARWTDLGRAAVQAIWDRMESLGIRKIKDIKGFSSGIGSFQPVEVYPGFLNTVQWEKFQEPQEPAEAVGTMDVYFEGAKTKTTITIACPKGVSGEGVYRLLGNTEESKYQSGCVEVLLLPAFTYQLEPINPEDKPVLSQFLKGYQRMKKDGKYYYTNLRLHLACAGGSSLPQSKSSIRVQWKAYMNYSKSADCFAFHDCKSSAHQLIRNLTTTRPSMEPHRIFAFSGTLEAFYREVSQDQRSIVLANIDFYRK